MCAQLLSGIGPRPIIPAPYHCGTFCRAGARTPDAVAVIAQGRMLTYRELDESANRLARRLQNLGVKPDTLVGVAMGRSETLVVSLLGISRPAARTFLSIPPIRRIAFRW